MTAKNNQENVVEIVDAPVPGNLDFWNDVEETNPEYTKAVGYGAHQFTAIDAYYQIKNATEKWGQYGARWGLFNTEYTPIPNTPLMQLHAEFVYPTTITVMANGTPQKQTARFPISSAIKYIDSKGKFDQDFVKKLETSLITKSLSRLGFNADVFLGKFDDNIYKDEMVKKFTDPQGVVHRIEHTEEDQKKYHQLLNDSNALDFFVLLSSMSEGASVSLWDTFPKGEITKSKAKATNLKHRGEKDFEQYLDQITERIISGDELGLIEIAEEISVDAKRMLFNRLSNEHQTMAREMLNAPE